MNVTFCCCCCEENAEFYNKRTFDLVCSSAEECMSHNFIKFGQHFFMYQHTKMQKSCLIWQISKNFNKPGMNIDLFIAK